MKKQRWLICIFICLFAAAIAILAICFERKNTPTLTAVTDEIQRNGTHIGNNRQHEASVWIGEYSSNLYFYSPHALKYSAYDGWLCLIKDGEIVKLHHMKEGGRSIKIVGVVDRYLYYWSYNITQEDLLYCYDLESRDEAFLYRGDANFAASLYFDDDGAIYVPLCVYNSGDTPQFVHVLGRTVVSVEPMAKGYQLGNQSYQVVSEYSDVVERIVCTDSDGKSEEVPLSAAHKRSIIPYPNGILVHNEAMTDMLYRIDEDGVVTNLFNVPCLSSVSAINVCGTDAYISFKRYEKYGEIGMLRYKNDELEGTYRISLLDCTVEKINNKIFNGLYNFDDTCFYCCDEEGNIYKMNFDGTVIPILQIAK